MIGEVKVAEQPNNVRLLQYVSKQGSRVYETLTLAALQRRFIQLVGVEGINPSTMQLWMPARSSALKSPSGEGARTEK